MLALRAANPDLWHPSRSGEKPFEMAVLTAVLRSDGVPPYDAWFSGGVLNYYYGGYLLLLAPARLLATAPGLTLNIGVAVFAGAAAGAAASAGALLTTGMRGARRSERRSWLGALAAVGTLAGANVAVAGETWRHWRQDGPFDWWSVSRVVPGRNDITEFPAWTFVFADLHPHLMSTALVATMVVVVAVVFQTVAGPGGLAGVAAAGLLAGALVGLVRATNTWDFPLAAGGVLAGVLAPRLWGAAWRRCAVAGVAASVTALGLWRPYVVRGQVFDSGVQRAVMHTPWASWATQFGWFAALTAVVVGPPLALAAWRSSPVRVARRWRLAAGVLGAGGTGLIAAGALLVWPWAWVLITTLALASACAWAAWQRRRAVGGLALAVTAAGWAIQAGVELVTVRNDIGRQNTVFKFWYQSWVLLAVGLAAVLVVHLTGRAWRPARWAAGALATGGAALALAFWALAVPARVDDRVSNGGWTLDGERYLSDPGEGASAGYQGATFRPADDWVLVEWLRGNVAGGVVAEAAGDDYQWTSRVAWLTGLPTPAGWRFHESQQRRAYGVTVDRRHSDLALLYTTTEPAEIARILASYTVAYVVVGTVERALASPESSAALSGFECLSVVFEHGQSYVASVDRACAYGVWRDALVAELAQPPT
jgi:YYY domain-containing protein